MSRKIETKSNNKRSAEEIKAPDSKKAHTEVSNHQTCPISTLNYFVMNASNYLSSYEKCANFKQFDIKEFPFAVVCNPTPLHFRLPVALQTLSSEWEEDKIRLIRGMPTKIESVHRTKAEAAEACAKEIKETNDAFISVLTESILTGSSVSIYILEIIELWQPGYVISAEDSAWIMEICDRMNETLDFNSYKSFYIFMIQFFAYIHRRLIKNGNHMAAAKRAYRVVILKHLDLENM